MKLFLDSYYLTCNSKCEKLLGAKLDRELTFYDHTSQLCENACRKISEGDTLYKYIYTLYKHLYSLRHLRQFKTTPVNIKQETFF